MPTTQPEFINKPIQIRRKKPWWWYSLDKKQEPTRERPMFILWSHVPAYGHAAHRHPAMCCAMRPSYNPQFFPIAGITQPSFDTQYTTGIYNTLDPATDELDLNSAQWDAKIDAHAAFMAEQVANMLFADNLFRGKGSHHDGQYGGAFHWHNLGVASWNAADAWFSFTPLMQHPGDAAARTVTVKTDAVTTRSITLPKRDIHGQPPISGTTAADLAAIEALSDGVRHSGYFTMRTSRGRARVYEMARRFFAYLKLFCDNYINPLTGSTHELCYPKFCPLSQEQLGYVLVGPTSRTIPADAPTIPTQYQEQVGSFWNERGDADVPNIPFTSETIFRDIAGRAYDLRSAMLADPVLASAPFLTAFAPTVGTSGGISTVAQNYAFRRLECHAQNWAIYDAIVRAAREFFPLMEFMNFDHVVVKDISAPYTRVGGGVQSTQTQNFLDWQAPTLYGRNTGSTVDDIKNQVAGAVGAWDWNNLEESLAVTDTLDTDGSDLFPYIHGVELESKIISGAKSEWGGTPEFMGRQLRAMQAKHGVRGYSVYSGDLDLTYATLCEISEELAAL